MNGRPSVAVRRVVICAVIAIAVADLMAQAAGVRVIHHSAAVTALGVVFPAAAVLSGLYYLRSTRGRS